MNKLTRTTIAKPSPIQMIDECERQAYFAQSARTVGGKRAEYDPDFVCEHDWSLCDDSFDHEFGTHRIPPYLECNICGEKKAIDADDRSPPVQREPSPAAKPGNTSSRHIHNERKFP